MMLSLFEAQPKSSVLSSTSINEMLMRQLKTLSKKSSEVNAINIQYLNEIKRLREMNGELLQRIHILEQTPNATEEAYNDELVRNAELEEMMTKLRRNNLTLRRQLEKQSAELFDLRQRCRELKRQSSNQRMSMERQRRTHTKTEQRLKLLRQLLIEKEPSFAARPSTSSIDFSSDTVAEDAFVSDYAASSNMTSTKDISLSPYWCSSMQTSFSLDKKAGVPRVASYHSHHMDDSIDSFKLIEPKVLNDSKVCAQSGYAPINGLTVNSMTGIVREGVAATVATEQEKNAENKQITDLLDLVKDLLQQNQDLTDVNNGLIELQAEKKKNGGTLMKGLSYFNL